MTDAPPAKKCNSKHPKEIYQDIPSNTKMESNQMVDSGDKEHTKRATHKRQSSAALLLIDLQNDFIEGSLAIRSCPSGHEALDIIPVVNKLRSHDFWRLVVWTLDSHPEDHCSFIDNVGKHPFHEKSPVRPEEAGAFSTVVLQGPPSHPEMEQKLWPAHCVEGTWGWKLHKDLRLEKDDKFVKKGVNATVDSYSAFYDNAKLNKTNLHDILRSAGVRDLYLCGLAWDYCVAFTALHGRELGYNVYVVADGCKGVDADGIDTMSERMRQAGVKFVTSQDLDKSLTDQETAAIAAAASSNKAAAAQQQRPGRPDEATCPSSTA